MSNMALPVSASDADEGPFVINLLAPVLKSLYVGASAEQMAYLEANYDMHAWLLSIGFFDPVERADKLEHYKKLDSLDKEAALCVYNMDTLKAQKQVEIQSRRARVTCIGTDTTMTDASGTVVMKPNISPLTPAHSYNKLSSTVVSIKQPQFSPSSQGFAIPPVSRINTPSLTNTVSNSGTSTTAVTSSSQASSESAIIKISAQVMAASQKLTEKPLVASSRAAPGLLPPSGSNTVYDTSLG